MRGRISGYMMTKENLRLYIPISRKRDALSLIKCSFDCGEIISK
jgi:hypothetical protein